MMRRRHQRAAGTSITYADVLQMHTACENYARAHVWVACAVSPKARWVKATNCCTRVDVETSGAASGLSRRNRRGQTRSRFQERAAIHTSLIALTSSHYHSLQLETPSQLKPKCQQTPGASFPPRSRPNGMRREAQKRGKNVVTLKAFTFGLIVTVCSDC